MAQTVTFAELVEWLEGTLPAQEARRVTTAVAADDMLRERAAWIGDFHSLAGDILLAGPPPALRQRLEALFEEPHTLAGNRMPFLNAELAGEDDAGGERRLCYETAVAGITLIVRQRPHAVDFDLHGAIHSRHDEQGLFAVELQRNGRSFALQASDPWGEFTFTHLPAGHYQLILSGEHVELAIAALPLGDVRLASLS